MLCSRANLHVGPQTKENGSSPKTLLLERNQKMLAKKHSLLSGDSVYALHKSLLIHNLQVLLFYYTLVW